MKSCRDLGGVVGVEQQAIPWVPVNGWVFVNITPRNIFTKYLKNNFIIFIFFTMS